MLVNYTIYQEQYFGKSIPEEEFNAYSRLSESYVNQYTFTRIQNTLSDQEKENVYFCICEIAEKLYDNDHLPSSKGITSESVDGHSVSFERRKTTTQLKPLIKDIINRWLCNTNLLYRGCL